MEVEGGDYVSLGAVSLVATQELAPGELQPIAFALEDRIALTGYSVDRRAVAPGETIRLRLRWEALRDVDEDYTVFAHLIGPQEEIRAQEDGQPGDGARPTGNWKPGDVVEDGYDLTVRGDTPPGVYQVEVGMYLPATGQRLRVFDEAGQLMGNRALLGGVRVLPGG
jgi:hypothetical protein